MGWCHVFGCRITSGCDQPMRAGATACTCSACQTVCRGRFTGCPEVWAQAPRPQHQQQPYPQPARGQPQGSPPRQGQGQPQGQPARPAQPTQAQPSQAQPSPAQAAAALANPPADLLSRQSGARILGWIRAEFEGVRAQLHALTSSVARQQAVVAELANGRGATAELEATVARLREEIGQLRQDATRLQEESVQLRNETVRLRGLDAAGVAEQLPDLVAGALQPALQAALDARMPAAVADTVQPAFQAALRDVEAVTAGLRDEAARLHAFREALTEQLPRIVDAAMRQALAAMPAPAPAAPAPAAATAGPGLAADPDDLLADDPGDDLPVPAGTTSPATTPEAAIAPAGDTEEVDPLACTLPGLVVGPSLALGVSDALRVAGLRRRRRRRAAAPVPGLHRRDPFASHVTRRLDRYARARANLASLRPAPRRNGQVPSGSTTVALGYRDAEEVPVDLADHAGLVVTGGAAADVARSVIASFLAQNGPGVGEAIVVGDLLPAVPPFPGLSQPADLAAALDLLTAELGRRVEEGPNLPGRPVLLLVAKGAVGAELAQLSALLADGRPLGIVGVVVDAAPEGATTVRVNGGDRVEEVGDERLAERLAGGRLYSLGREATSELLTVLASARTDRELIALAPLAPEPFDVQILPSAPVSVHLLGGYRIDVGGTEIRAGLRAKAKELLAFYLLHPEGTTLDAAVEALWPEADPGRGSEWFWTALGNLRSRLREATGERKLKVIERDGDRYKVEPLFDVDLWRLEAALAEGAAHDTDFARTAAYDKVAAAYAGELLAGFDWAWAETPREDLRQRVVDVLVWLGDIRWAASDARGAWQGLQRALEVDPYAEQIYRRIMRLQAKLSRPDDAAATYRRLQSRLAEVDLEPTPESEKLYVELCSSVL